MTVVAELDMRPKRLLGRQPRPPETAFVRELVEADMALLTAERGTQKPVEIKSLRERHHALARCLSRGASDADAAAMTGYTVSRISILRSDPTFAELMAHYQGVKDFAFADFQERASAVAIDSLNIIADRIEEDPEAISTGQALEIVKQLADRTGHSPLTRTQNTNVNVDLTARLTAARNRVAAAYNVPDPGGG
jgi:hypothetical protein